jgi:hypothetical protein
MTGNDGAVIHNIRDGKGSGQASTEYIVFSMGQVEVQNTVAV